MKKLNYAVYFDQGHAVLEIQRKENLYSIYFVDEEGNGEFIQNQDAPYAPSNKLPADPYYIDRASGPALRTIDVLTTVMNYDEIIGKLKFLDSIVEEGKYKYTDFSMELSYIMIDLVDAIKQAALLTEEESYVKKADGAYAFFETHFFSRTSELSSEDFKEIKTFLNQQIKFLESLKDQ